MQPKKFFLHEIKIQHGRHEKESPSVQLAVSSWHSNNKKWSKYSPCSYFITINRLFIELQCSLTLESVYSGERNFKWNLNVIWFIIQLLLLLEREKRERDMAVMKRRIRGRKKTFIKTNSKFFESRFVARGWNLLFYLKNLINLINLK